MQRLTLRAYGQIVIEATTAPNVAEFVAAARCDNRRSRLHEIVADRVGHPSLRFLKLRSNTRSSAGSRPQQQPRRRFRSRRTFRGTEYDDRSMTKNGPDCAIRTDADAQARPDRGRFDRSAFQASSFGDAGSEIERALQFIAIIERLAVYPDLHQAEKRDPAHLLEDLLLGGRHCFSRSSFEVPAAPREFGIGRIRNGEVRNSGRFPIAESRMVELSEINYPLPDIAQRRKTRRRQVLADLFWYVG